ncbi:hypothetical protein [Anaeromyxobacter soli]|uniref:hypothetical protein n=1 Tax=Anaeromyxobacter soli TaxID=2922725 RepID=UPI001FAF5193|nr:hypothetical protein [Anaeromyxobacter sp. SG29]
MRRLLAPIAVAAVLSLRPGLALAGEPLDLDLARLGAPSADVWKRLAKVQDTPFTLSDSEAALLASEAKTRFAILSTETALALSSAILTPASTTGYVGFDVDLEAAYVAVHPGTVGRTSFGSPPVFEPRGPWQTRSMTPHELFLPSVHVRKSLPFSLELGGRMIYLSQSSYFGAQVEGKWALNEGFRVLPDLAVRVAHTQLFGQRDWNLGATDLDLMVSKRFGVNGVTSFTPYLAGRFTYVGASSETMDFGPRRAGGTTATAPADLRSTQAAFPKLRAGFYRTTAGVRFTAHVVSLAGEVTYFGGATKDGKANPAADEYPDYRLASTWGGALKAGWEF